eukprot:TRINITY_DN4160_c0_g1_i1.p1 TRINITY_DN4160_c0_g1~~TRINITY_DN4160_c0_g1_i1.p1  ORF type:complete len:252 (-),score=72.81 TRINITY_DN4160_c0_g1_i1:225-980(-)
MVETNDLSTASYVFGALMCFALGVYFVLQMVWRFIKSQEGKTWIHELGIATTVISFLAYYQIATGYVTWNLVKNTPIFLPHYFSWTLILPLQGMMFCTISGAPNATTFLISFFGFVFGLSGHTSSEMPNSYEYGYSTWGFIFMCLFILMLLFEFRRVTTNWGFSHRVSRLFLVALIISCCCYVLYWVIWLFGGSNLALFPEELDLISLIMIDVVLVIVVNLVVLILGNGAIEDLQNSSSTTSLGESSLLAD